MSDLTKEQIDAVIIWMNSWEQLKDTVIPIRFKEHFTKLEPTKVVSIGFMYNSSEIVITINQKAWVYKDKSDILKKAVESALNL